jgi:hypothetical protein
MSLHANYSQVIVAVLAQAWNIYGPFSRANHQEVSRWVQTRVNEIRDGFRDRPPAAPAVLLEFPRA